ncbi:MAG TPA: SDR family oxidoreductase [Stellaceae bacterium]|nr:SDR family oxidoreductase [Stellaceae bacterium]
MQGKVCVITGATSGIGLAAATALAERGAELALVGRDPARGDAVLKQLRSQNPDLRAAIHYADLSRMDEVRRLGQELLAAYPRIDILINNAGALFPRREVTVDGLERTFALNHMAYFLLTNLLRERLIASSPARIVNVASRAHEDAVLDFADLNIELDYTGWTAYRRSKLANILFTRELARRLRGTGVTANSLHPGFVASRFGDNCEGVYRMGMGLAKRLFAIRPESAAETIVYLASAGELEGESGGYFARSAPAQLSSAAQDEAAARRLWELSAEIARIPA